MREGTDEIDNGVDQKGESASAAFISVSEIVSELCKVSWDLVLMKHNVWVLRLELRDYNFASDVFHWDSTLIIQGRISKACSAKKQSIVSVPYRQISTDVTEQLTKLINNNPDLKTILSKSDKSIAFLEREEESQAHKDITKRSAGFLVRRPLLIALFAFVVMFMGLIILEKTGDYITDLFNQTVLEFLRCVTMAFFLFLISREKTLDKCGKQTGDVFNIMGGFLLVSLILGVLSIEDESVLYSDWGVRLVLCFFDCIFAGLLEELFFRAILNDALIYQFRKLKGVFVMSALLCFLGFGCMHVLFEDVSTLLMASQAVLKALETSIFGFCMLIAYWKTRDIWGCGLAHGVHNFYLLAASSIFMSKEPAQTDYILAGDKGAELAHFYLILSAVYILFLIRIWKTEAKKLNFKEMRENW